MQADGTGLTSRSWEAVQAASIPMFVYRLYDDDSLLYVGSTGNLWHRLKQHSATKIWWSRVRRVDVTTCSSRAAAEAEEERAISDEAPMMNKAGVSSPYISRATRAHGPQGRGKAHDDASIVHGRIDDSERPMG